MAKVQYYLRSAYLNSNYRHLYLRRSLNEEDNLLGPKGSVKWSLTPNIKEAFPLNSREVADALYDDMNRRGWRIEVEEVADGTN